MSKIAVKFMPNDVVIDAEPGEPMLEVARRAGVSIPTGCLMGSCHACEVELDDGSCLCACISGIPGDRPEITINLFSDPVW
ncbi:2Fe-2S iron-sulfur cluster-binding protein [[Limnothrix rosea] IAM M-220]|uniref:2Fe-2S iron-sulfur cluster-binding protein n=1 Tax=[Limnothrix rosea] IAM M-220 TaxID=454133 RepID=UPI0009649C3E|nr:2Fe-2S iron-sulfur cluster-binding protein [[Limnothrix rosea] IAM M-220]OKH19552.1 (2Fe-2S)-binding protein [[Limnothrix rosea] IAM M-220]